MKTEVLGIRKFNLRYSHAVSLKSVSLTLMEGECYALMGLASSGKDAFLQVITGKEWSDNGVIRIDNKKIDNFEQLRSSVHLITELNYSITDWTISEYIGLVSDSFFSLFHRKKLLSEQMQDLFLKLDIEIDVNRKLSDLSEIEKRVIDLVKAYNKGSRILVISDEFDGASSVEISEFKAILDRIVHGSMTVLIKSNSESVSNILADKYIIFKNGSIIKKCKKDFFKNANQLEAFLLGESKIKNSMEKIPRISGAEIFEESIYEVKNIVTSIHESYSFKFKKGEVVSILALNIRKKEKIFNVLSGREIDKVAEFIVTHKRCNFNSIYGFVKNRIVSSINLGTDCEYLDKMTLGENVLIPSLAKISISKYMLYGRRMAEMLEGQVKLENEYGEILKDDETNLRIQVMMERWFIFKPKVIVLLEPFLHCDVYGVSIIKSYIKKFSDIGTAVIIVKAREKDIMDISEKIIKI